MKRKSLTIICMLAVIAFLGVKTQFSNSMLKENVFAFTNNGGDNNDYPYPTERYVYPRGDVKPNNYISFYVVNFGGPGPVNECDSIGWGKPSPATTCLELW